MSSLPSQPALALRTTTKLLDALRDPRNEPAWTHLDQRYRGVIAGLARRLGLSTTDADEVAQQTLTEFVRVYREGRYDRSKGRLSSWILSIAHHTALHLVRSNRRPGVGGAGGAGAVEATLSQVEGESSLRGLWDDERDRAILARALQHLRDDSATDDRTLRAFELVGLRGVPAEEAARQCQMSVDQVYVAKARVTKRLKVMVAELTAAFEEDV